MTAAVDIPTALWSDPNWIGLRGSDQWVLMRLLTMRELDSAGMATVTTRRWAVDWLHPEALIVDGMANLADHGYLRVDDETQELLLPMFVGWQRIGGQPRRVAGAWDAISRHYSAQLKSRAWSALNDEIDRASRARRNPHPLRMQVFDRDGWRCVECSWSPGD